MQINNTSNLSSRNNYRPQTSGQNVASLQQDVHELTEQTDQFYQQHLTSMSLTSTAGLSVLAGGALSMLSATQSMGLALAGIGGAALVAGIGLCAHTYSKHSQSEKQRLAVAGELFYARESLNQERVRDIFRGSA